MFWSSPWTAPWGNPDDIVDIRGVTGNGGGLRLQFEPRSGYDGFYKIYVDGTPGPVVYATNGVVAEVFAPYNEPEFAATAHTISICPQGNWPLDIFDLSFQAFNFQTGRQDRIWVKATAAPEFFVYSAAGIDAQLSAWAVTGISRFANCFTVPGRPSWGALMLTLANAAGVRTVTLSSGGTTIATGSRTGDGSITLVAANSSGVSGTVMVTYTGNLTATLVACFPDNMKFHHKTTQFTAPDFPRTAEGTVYDDGYATALTYRSARLTAGTYYIVPHQTNEMGVESAGLAGGGTTVTIHTPPEPPGVPVYASGGAAATVINFAASATASATYNIYDGGEGTLDINTVTGTHIAGTGTLSQTLPAIGGGFSGTRYVVVRAVLGGVEEGNYQVLEIEYAVGVVVLPRPPIPGYGIGYSTAARALTVPVTINTNDQLAAAATVELFIVAHGAAFNYAVPIATAAVTAAANSLINLSIAGTVAGDGQYDFGVKTKTTGGVQSSNTERFGPVRLATAAPVDPASFEAKEGM